VRSGGRKKKKKCGVKGQIKTKRGKISRAILKEKFGREGSELRDERRKGKGGGDGCIAGQKGKIKWNGAGKKEKGGRPLKET